ncbi:MAG: hypothetical protein ACYC4Q_00445 [Victivallaceae bacterium]
MDSGPVLGISPACGIDFMGADIAELRKIAAARPLRKPQGGYKDLLETIALHNQARLKPQGDWIVFPPVVADFAAGKFGCDSEGGLYCDNDGKWTRIRTVEYSDSGKTLID